MNYNSLNMKEYPNYPFSIKEVKSRLAELGIDHRICEISLTDFSVNVHGNVNISNKQLKFIPIIFNKVYGKFDCSSNKLKSLYGSPKIVDGDFSAEANDLSSLEYCPCSVKKIFNAGSNELTKVDFLPKDFERLKLYNNRITEFKSLDPEYENCVEIDVSHNQLTNIDFVSSFGSVIELIVLYNKIEKIDISVELNKLIYLNASHNFIQFVKLESAPALRHLILKANQITDLSQKIIDKLNILSLESNPIQNLDIFLNLKPILDLGLDYDKMDIETQINFCTHYKSTYLKMLKIIDEKTERNPSQKTVLDVLYKMKTKQDKIKIIMDEL